MERGTKMHYNSAIIVIPVFGFVCFDLLGGGGNWTHKFFKILKCSNLQEYNLRVNRIFLRLGGGTDPVYAP